MDPSSKASSSNAATEKQVEPIETQVETQLGLLTTASANTTKDWVLRTFYNQEQTVTDVMLKLAEEEGEKGGDDSVQQDEQPVSWADYTETSDDEIKCNDSDTEGIASSNSSTDNHPEGAQDYQEIDRSVSSIIETCLCRHFTDLESALSLLDVMASVEFGLETYECIIDNIIRVYNFVFGTVHEAVSEFKIAFTDKFFRIRHEVLFKFLCLTLNLPITKSDRPFSDFGIESNRTPDLIIVKEGLLIIVEVTATSSIERAAVNKGMETLGFEGKYQKELNLLSDMGRSCIYLPMFFNMGNPSGPVESGQLNELCKVFGYNDKFKVMLHWAAKSFAILTNNIKTGLVLSSAILFTKYEEIKPNHPEHEFLYSKVHQNEVTKHYYKQLKVSPNIYNLVSNNVARMYRMLDNSKFPDTNNVKFIIETNTGKISLIKDKTGITVPDLRELLNTNDMSQILKYVDLKVDRAQISSLDSDTGLVFYERIDKKHFMNDFIEIPLNRDHGTLLHLGDLDLLKYVKLANLHKSQEIYCNIYDPKYEDKIIQSIIDLDMSQQIDDCSYRIGSCGNNLLGGKLAQNIDMFTVINNIKEEYVNINTPNDSLPITKLKMKAPFILPMADLNESSYCKLDVKNTHFIEGVIEKIYDNPYTKLILDNVLKESYKMYSGPICPSKPLREIMEERMMLSNQMNSLQKRIYKLKGYSGTFKLSKVDDPEIKQEFDILRGKLKLANKEISARKKNEGYVDNMSTIRLPTKNKKSGLRELFQIEMKHFKDKTKQSTIEGVGIIHSPEVDYKADFDVFNNLINYLVVFAGNNPDLLIDANVAHDSKLLHDLKKIALQEYVPMIENLKNSVLGHACALISRLAHTLLYYSQLPFSSDYIRVDNLGYKNVLLIVKGGKKIFKSHSSKLFRLIIPIMDCVVPWYLKGHYDKGSIKLMNISGTKYLITPWAMMHESILTDSLSFYPRVMSFCALNLDNKISLAEQFHKISINVLLAFHNRRQTEALLANMRYILLSSLGDFTGIEEILNDFFKFNYDRFQSFIRNSIFLNYPKYFKNVQHLKGNALSNSKEINESDFMNSGLKNIFTNQVIRNSEELALMIYSTFLMTKAPYQKVTERARNLKGILKIHKQYSEEVGVDLTPKMQLEKLSVTLLNSYSDYSDNLMSRDFNFDPKYCANVGQFADSLLLEQNLMDDANAEWIKIINQSWDELATSTGLRGNLNDVENFWGKKGYFIVYKELLSNHEYVIGIKEIFLESLTDSEKRKKMRDLNILYKDKIVGESTFLVFHAVDKVQWRDNREIYVMDLFTKTLQQPIEKYMGYLCTKLDNELISIPSDKRAQVIHHSIFEKDLPIKGSLTWYLTLDCSKWAPKSIFSKFAIMLNNMSIVPNSFKIHFMNYIEKLYKKRIYFNSAEVNAVKRNVRYTKLCSEYLKFDESVKGYYLEMDYSWVMGIFNYTSSFMHAANQKYFSYLLTKTTIMSYKEETAITMFAHSDDSGGRISAGSIFMVGRALKLYEVNLKCCNHLLSKKKSVVSRIYFEILSIIYLFKKLLALLPKFLGGLRFLPTDKGPAQDMLQSYSKTIEVIIAGADFSTAYIVLKIMSMMIWRFYNTKPPMDIDYERPVQYLGMPDCHPIMALLCGSDADLLRLLDKDEDKLSNLISFVNTTLLTNDSEGPIKPLKFRIKVRGIEKGFEPYIELFENILDSWSVRNVNYHNTPMNTLSFLRKLSDPGFVGSLVNESTVRRLSRCFYVRSGNGTITRFGDVSLRTVLDSLRLFQSYSDKSSAVSHIMSDIIGEEATNIIVTELSNADQGARLNVELLKKTLYSPMKINHYFNQLSMEGREITQNKRTLKPTLVQLVRSSKVFSVDFDPASLVSIIKEPELSWAISNVKNLSTAKVELESFLSKLEILIQDVSPDMLLRVARTYGRESVKSIYIYSRVPHNVRQVKTYGSFLTFLSVNTFSDREISGLSLKSSDRDLNKEYLESNINDEIYLMNNLISFLYVLALKCDIDFVLDLNIKPIKYINFEGGKVVELLDIIAKCIENDVYGCLLKCQFYSLEAYFRGFKANGSELKKGAFYTFLKAQRIRSSWFGKGEIYINIENTFYSFRIEGTELLEVFTNKTGKLPDHHTEYILDVLQAVNISKRSLDKTGGRTKKRTGANKLVFGYDFAKGFSVSDNKDIEFGISATLIASRDDFVDNLNNFNFDSMRKDNIMLKYQSHDIIIKKKIYFLPIKKLELVTFLPKVLYKEDFENKLLNLGLNTFEEFIMTEILVEYGDELTIGFKELFDNFTASKLFEIFREVRRRGLSLIPIRAVDSIIPAPEGSLTRILLDYSIATGERILSTPTNLDHTLMQVRSEFPENMSVILAENLVKYHKTIYDSREIREISDQYMIISENESVEQTRKAIIKLMSFWGYGGLVNTLTDYKLLRSEASYTYYTLNLINKVNNDLISELYLDAFKYIKATLEEFQAVVSEIEVPNPFLLKYFTLLESIFGYFINTVMELYNLDYIGINTSFMTLCFNNYLLGFLNEEDFNNSLQSKFSNNIILGTLQIDVKNKYNFVVFLNTLRAIWMSKNKNNISLDYLLKVQRLDNVKYPRSYYKEVDINLPPIEQKYHGTINDETKSHILNNSLITLGNKRYYISSSFNNFSRVIVPVLEEIKVNRPVSQEIIDSDEWEDYLYEFEMIDLDIDTILEMWEGFENKYAKKKTKETKQKGVTVIKGHVNWVIGMHIESKKGILDKVRQIGENVVILTNTILVNFVKFFPNSGVRFVNYKHFTGTDRKYIVYYTLQNELYNKKFIDKYIGGVDFITDYSFIEKYKLNYIRDIDGTVKDIKQRGLAIGAKIFSGEDRLIEVDNVVERVSYDEFKTRESKTVEEKINKLRSEGVLPELDNDDQQNEADIAYLEKLGNLKIKLKEIKDEGKLPESVVRSLEEKYINVQKTEGVSAKVLMKSLITEKELTQVAEEIYQSKLALSFDEQKKTFLSPEFFSAAYQINYSSKNAFKDRKIKSEIESIHSGLSTGVGSCTLKISEKYKKTLLAHYKTWTIMTKSSPFKKDNKRFLLTTFLSILNSAPKTNDNRDDLMWHEIVDKITEYIADTGDEGDQDNDDLNYLTEFEPASRLRYKLVGT